MANALPIAKPSSGMEAMTGIPSGKKPKPIRRGGGRMKKKAVGHETHNANLQAALKKGDHQAAKTHALHLAKALHAATKMSPQLPDTGMDGM